MSSAMMILDILIVLGLVVSAVLAVHFEKLLSAAICLGATGLFAAAAFLLMHAPDVAISEAAVGAALFFISDGTLFFVRFKKDTRLKTHFLVMLTYSIGEFLIILGLL